MGPKLTAQVIREDYSVLEDPGFSTGIVNGTLRVDRLTPARAGIVSLIVAQSAAMEYYDESSDRLSSRTPSFVERLERRGSVPCARARSIVSSARPFRPAARCCRCSICSTNRTRRGTTRDGSDIRRLAGRVRPGRSLSGARAQVARSQESLELLAEVARDRRVLWLEIIVVILILLEVVMPGFGYR